MSGHRDSPLYIQFLRVHSLSKFLLYTNYHEWGPRVIIIFPFFNPPPHSLSPTAAPLSLPPPPRPSSPDLRRRPPPPPAAGLATRRRDPGAEAEARAAGARAGPRSAPTTLAIAAALPDPARAAAGRLRAEQIPARLAELAFPVRAWDGRSPLPALELPALLPFRARVP